MGNSVLARNLLLLGALDEIAAAAAARKLDFLLLKGAALLAEGSRSPEEREMTDLDLLVRQRDESPFDDLLKGLGFRPMENSSQAYYRMAGLAAPPVIADLHTALWNEKDTSALWHRSRFLKPAGPAGTANAAVPIKALGFEDQFLHIASHPLLYHGRLSRRDLDDAACFLSSVFERTERRGFFLKAAEIARSGGLNAAVYPVLKRLAALEPSGLTAEELRLFEPAGISRVKNFFFEKAARKYSRRLEYFLPGLYRPGLFFRYLFPERTFMERRYGSNSLLNRVRRPFRLIAALFMKGTD